MSTPEAVHARLMSGNPGALRQASETVDDDARTVAEANGGIRELRAVENWSGGSYLAYVMRVGLLDGRTRAAGDTTRSVADVLSWAANANQRASDEAEALWSLAGPRPETGSAEEQATWETSLLGPLGDLEDAYDRVIGVLAAALDDDEVRVPFDEIDEEHHDWLDAGRTKSEQWTAESGSSEGPVIPNVAASGDRRGWIPQGLAYDDGSGMLAQAYYTKGDDASAYLALVERTTGREAGEVELRAPDGGNPGHAGGVTFAEGDVVLASSGTLYVYDRDEVYGAQPGDAVVAREQIAVGGGGATSYVTYSGGQLFVGNSSAGTLTPYVRSEGGRWRPDTDANGSPITIPAPDRAQGVVVRENELVFSVSGTGGGNPGRLNPSYLVSQDRATDERGEPYELPPLAQGIVEVDGQVVTSYESGADHFSTLSGSFLDSLGDFFGISGGATDALWPSTRYTQTPLTEIDGLTVDPEALDRTAAAFLDPAAGLRTAAGSLASVGVTVYDLLPTPNASAFVTALTARLDSLVDTLLAAATDAEEVSDATSTTSSGVAGTDESVRQTFHVPGASW